MAKVYFDTNILNDLVGENRYGFDLITRDSEVVISTLSVHILAYVLKIKIPNSHFRELVRGTITVDLDGTVVEKAMKGPTDDFGDNVQLHSAVEEECDCFLTLDKKLLKMKYFGKMKICSKLK